MTPPDPPVPSWLVQVPVLPRAVLTTIQDRLTAAAMTSQVVRVSNAGTTYVVEGDHLVLDEILRAAAPDGDWEVVPLPVGGAPYSSTAPSTATARTLRELATFLVGYVHDPGRPVPPALWAHEFVAHVVVALGGPLAVDDHRFVLELWQRCVTRFRLDRPIGDAPVDPRVPLPRVAGDDGAGRSIPPPQLRPAPDEAAVLEFVVSALAGWGPGAVVRVAFLGGDTQLHQKIADATRQITAACNVVLDFGQDSTGACRTWTTVYTGHAAETGVSFDQPGYFSLVGTDSTDPTIAPFGGLVGGNPGQRSLNLGGFDVRLPVGWEGTVRHQFLHALAFGHEHQNLRGPCEGEFRWEDDPGSVPTCGPGGRFVHDTAGRAPGIYTSLAGPPNRWPRSKVDHNLRTVPDPDLTSGPFDPESVMLYRFEDFFYRTSPSLCAPTGDGLDLSAGDVEGPRLLYPQAPGAVAERREWARRALERCFGSESPAAASPYEERVVELLWAAAR